MSITLNGTTGLAGANGSASTPAVQGEDANTGIFFPAADTVAVATAGAERLRVAGGGAVGVGVTPSAWAAPAAVTLELTNGANLFSSVESVFQMGANNFYDGAYKYKTNGFASRYRQDSGTHNWDTAPSGTAGGALTFTRAMTLDASGRLSVPGQPVFSAGSDASNVSYGSGAIIPFNVKNYDRGNNFNTSTYRFTAPVGGAYFFCVSVYAFTQRVALTLFVNGAQIPLWGGDVVPYAFKADSATPADMTVGFNYHVALNGGDYVSVNVRNGYSSQLYGGHSTFSGHFLG